TQTSLARDRRAPPTQRGPGTAPQPAPTPRRPARVRPHTLTRRRAGEKAPAREDTMAEAEQSYTTEIEASVEQCWDVLLDFDRYPAWSGPVTACKVLERDADGRARVVEMTLDMKIRNVRYVLQYEYD